MILRALLLLIIFTIPAFAADQSLRFRDMPKDVREESVIAMLESSKKLNPEFSYQIAAFDLNGDGVDEWIVKQAMSSACESDKSCRFLIAGISKNQPILLGELTAGSVTVAPEKSYGVRNLEVSTNPADDFSYETYQWKPESRLYVLR